MGQTEFTIFRIKRQKQLLYRNSKFNVLKLTIVFSSSSLCKDDRLMLMTTNSFGR